jgi:hypothetical protein
MKVLARDATTADTLPLQRFRLVRIRTSECGVEATHIHPLNGLRHSSEDGVLDWGLAV